MGRGRFGTLAVTGTMIAVAALLTLSTTAASAATARSSAPAHVTAPSAAEAASGCVTETFTTADEPYYEPCVLDAQVLLNNLWSKGLPHLYQLATDASYGPLTAGDVTQFQRDAGDGVDGELGPETWGSLCILNEDYGFTGAYWHGAGCNTLMSP
jgi:peptidoglycan hydrolase-like protein with peptidoglycan-binding domain